ncbi:MAG: 4-hydroxy-3-methylbut-2-enyl diphosphate reductase, partial [Clostridia bacterium]|nr:4-hydroxy-3-methylbut-2-enyl diphosphate reductase [Clostridia bacterium]
MDIRIAKNAGFCPGVKRAAEFVYGLARNTSRGRIYTLGELIHNNEVLRDLRSLGVEALGENELIERAEAADAGCPVTAVIRTHGVPDGTERRLREITERNPFFRLRDMTCPYVKKIHGIVEENPDCHVIVSGDPEHPEVKGIVSRAVSYSVAENADDLDGIDAGGRQVILVSQTTQNRRNWDKIRKEFEKRFPDGLIFDTICSVTEKRQQEAAALSGECDAVIVIGGRQSSNSRKLYDIASEHCRNTFFVESAEDVPENVNQFRKIGITAGASTPDRLIEEVYKQMSEKKENFAELLESAFKTLHTGETVTGIVSAISGNELHIDLGVKLTGVITAEEASSDPNAKLSDLFKIGDEIEAIVMKLNDREGVAELSKRRADARIHWKKIADAVESREVLEGTVTQAVSQGVIISFEGYNVFIPASQSGVAKDEDLNTLVGQTTRFRILEADERKKRAIGSIRRVLNAERRAKAAELWANIKEGDWFDGTVRTIVPYGVFVDLGYGVDGMVHISELSWGHLRKPSDIVKVGDQIRVYVKNVDLESKRISLGYKTEGTNPWKIFKDNYALNDIVKVKVVNVMPFGAFAEI